MSPGPEQDLSLEQTRDDTDRGWGDDLRADGDGRGEDGPERDRDAWLRREVPPHHGD